MSDAITLVIGGLTLVSAFVLFIHLAFLGNIGNGVGLSVLLAGCTLVASAVYLIVLIVLAAKRGSCRWCLCYLIGFSIYISAMIVYISSEDLADALAGEPSRYLPSLIYIAMPIVFLVRLLLVNVKKSKRPGSN